MNDTAKHKTELRRQLRRARQNIPPKQRQIAERKTQNHLSRFVQRGKRIGLYCPIGSEMRLSRIVQIAKRRGAIVYLPYIEAGKRRLWFTRLPENAVAERQSARNRLRIPQYAGKKIRAHQLHTLIVPLVGIDQRGYRLGQGGGFYDTTLAAAQRSAVSPRTVGVGFACQQCEAVPIEAHDKPLNYFACERGLQRFQAA